MTINQGVATLYSMKFSYAMRGAGSLRSSELLESRVSSEALDVVPGMLK